jgi:thiamine-monophosphate kinase
MPWSEDKLHLWLARGAKPKGLAGSRGHDAAVLDHLPGRPVVCTDQCVEGVHFTRSTPPRDVGRKACARALSDLAATAATPRAVLLALDAPADRAQSWLEQAISGVRDVARSFRADLVGGDLCASEGPARLTVTALGAFASAEPAPGRDRARAGDTILLTGPVGGSLLGRHLRIRPRVAEGIWLFSRGATALMDVSDGLAWDLFRLARASRVGIQLDVEHVPIHPDAHRLARRTRRAALDHALHDGEDHELIVVVPTPLVRTLALESAKHCPSLRPIGRVVRGSGLRLRHERGRIERWSPARGGFKHGA